MRKWLNIPSGGDEFHSDYSVKSKISGLRFMFLNFSGFVCLVSGRLCRKWVAELAVCCDLCQV